MIADKSINLDTLHKVLFDNEKLELSEECIRKVEESFDFLQSFSSDKIIYGINTGFGPMAQYRIEDQSLIDLQYNIIRSHSTGAGKPLPELYVKAAMITNPHGLQDENHYTTPYDIYLMLKEALNYPEFTDITQMSSYTVTYKHSDGSDASTTLTATDHYLTGEATTPKDVTILGGKTGTTDKAGNCLALLSQNAYGKPFISIVMGASSKDVLYQEMTSLLQNIN